MSGLLTPRRRAILCLLLCLLATGLAAFVLTAPGREEQALSNAALSELLVAAQEHPTNSRVFYHLGQRAAASGQSQIARDAFTYAAGLAPDEERIWLAWAETAQDPRQGVGILRTYLRNHSRSAAARLLLARLYQRLEAHPSAYVEAIQAASLRPNDARAWGLAGEEALLSHNLSDAEAALRRAVTLDPTDQASHVRLGYTLIREGNLREAQDILRSVTHSNPPDAAPYLALGTALLTAAQTPAEIEEARQNLEKAIARAPDSARAYLYLGRCYEHTAAWTTAKGYLETAARLDPDDPEVHYDLGRALRALGDTVGAAKEIAQHRRLTAYRSQKSLLSARFRTGNDLEAGMSLAQLLIQGREFTQAEAVYRSILLRSSPSSNVAALARAALSHLPQ